MKPVSTLPESMKGPSWRIRKGGSSQSGDYTFTIGAGTVGGMKPDNCSGTDDPLEVPMNYEADGHPPSTNPKLVWLECEVALGGDLGATVASATLKAEYKSLLASENEHWPHYPQQWNFETNLVGRLVLSEIAFFSFWGGDIGDTSKINHIPVITRKVTHNMLVVSPVISACNVELPLWVNGALVGYTGAGYSSKKSGLFFCQTGGVDDNGNPTPALFDPADTMF